MFVTFAPQNVETVGMRRARKAGDTTRSRRTSIGTTASGLTSSSGSASVIHPNPPRAEKIKDREKEKEKEKQSGKSSGGFFRRRRRGSKESAHTLSGNQKHPVSCVNDPIDFPISPPTLTTSHELNPHELNSHEPASQAHAEPTAIGEATVSDKAGTVNQAPDTESTPAPQPASAVEHAVAIEDAVAIGEAVPQNEVTSDRQARAIGEAIALEQEVSKQVQPFSVARPIQQESPPISPASIATSQLSNDLPSPLLQELLDSYPTAQQVEQSTPVPPPSNRTTFKTSSYSQLRHSNGRAPKQTLSLFPIPPPPLRLSAAPPTPPPSQALPTPPSSRRINAPKPEFPVPPLDKTSYEAVLSHDLRINIEKNATEEPSQPPQVARPASPTSTVASDYSYNTVFTAPKSNSSRMSSTTDFTSQFPPIPYRQSSKPRATGPSNASPITPYSASEMSFNPSSTSLTDSPIVPPLDADVVPFLKSPRFAGHEPRSSVLPSPPAPVAPTPRSSFGRTLAKMEKARPRIIAARISEEWDADSSDDEGYQEVVFEKRLWALTAYQWLTQGKQLQSPIHEMLLTSRPETGGHRVLHLHGSIADGWTLAARYPSATVYTVSCCSNPVHPPSYSAPLNHHSLFLPSTSSSMPFPDTYFDAVVSRSLPTLLSKYDWFSLFRDCARVLKPGAYMEVHCLDPCVARQGPLLKSWVDKHILSRFEAQGMLDLPSTATVNAMSVAGLQGVKRARLGMSAWGGRAKGRRDEEKMIMQLGRHVYEECYREFVRKEEGEEWFWEDEEIDRECEELQTQLVLTIACGIKS